MYSAECKKNPCKHEGTCYIKKGTETCDCKGTGYEGRTCEKETNIACKACEHGVCNEENSYTCVCLEGYEGPNCKKDKDECLNDPCNNGQCINEIGDYRCECTTGLRGKNCEININECDSSPCQNNGKCKDGLGKFMCKCDGTGFEGDTCEIPINDCKEDSCGEHGTCQDLVNNVTCICETGYEGAKCQFPTCLASLCQNNSPCKELGSDLRNPDYECQCTEGFSGKNCQTQDYSMFTMFLKNVSLVC